MIGESEIAADAGIAPRAELQEQLRQLGAEFKVRVTSEEVNAEGAVVVDKNSNRFTIPADTVVLALGYQA